MQGLQLDDNRIIGNGPRTQEPAGNAQTGIRGGVHIWIILPVIEQSSSFSPTCRRPAIGTERRIELRDARQHHRGADGSRGNVSRAWADGCCANLVAGCAGERGLI